ncbi:lactate dehydrogenase [Psychrobacillus sp. FSL K6-4046]|uniref:lactate dehydrogenase n=1 Tax=Psychrobacillus sp. FSL K6-4046 TaxID=2921550 RepID=UPI00315AB9F0
MELLLNRLHEGIEYLSSQGKQVTLIKMNPDIFASLTQDTLSNVEMSFNAATVFGVPMESDENVEKYEFIISRPLNQILTINRGYPLRVAPIL